MRSYEISEYIDNLPLQASFCKGYKPDEVYEVICTISSMYNQILSEAYEENEELKRKIDFMETYNRNGSVSGKTEDELLTEVKEEKAVLKEETKAQPLSDKELQRLKRGELLEILLDQSRENESLKLQLEEKSRMIEDLNSKLASRKIAIREAGTIADASLKLNGVFEAAQAAAQQYLDNLQDLYQQESSSFLKREAEIETKCTAMLQATKERCDCMKEDIERQCAQLETEAKTNCERMRETVEKECREREQAADINCRAREQEAEDRCRAFDLKAKEDVDRRWEELSKRLEAFYNAHEGLKDIMSASKII